MIKYEYRVIDYDMFGEQLSSGLTYMGLKGWDIIRIFDPMKWINADTPDQLFVRVFYKRILETNTKI